MIVVDFRRPNLRCVVPTATATTIDTPVVNINLVRRKLIP